MHVDAVGAPMRIQSGGCGSVLWIAGQLQARLEAGGEVFLSNAVLDGAYVLRGCIVNFRTSEADVRAIPEIVVREGRRLWSETS